MARPKGSKNKVSRMIKIKCDNCGKEYLIYPYIKGWRDYPKLRYKIKNGITLCQAHHPRKRAEEKRLEPLFEALVSVLN